MLLPVPLHLRRVLIPAALLAGASALVADGVGPDTAAIPDLRFTVDLYRRLAAQPGNLFLSPFSVSEVLSMALAGARGSTAAEMAAVLHAPLAESPAATGPERLRAQLATAGNDRVTLATANSLWVQSRAPLRAEYVRIIHDGFDAEATPVDFVQAAESARNAINAWVDHRTHGKIPGVIAPGVLGPRTRIVLVNAVYFNGRWATPFEPRQTRPAPFFLTPTRSVPVPTMHRVLRLRTVALDGLRLVELPYAGRTMSMVLLLPDESSTLPDVELRLTSDHLTGWLRRLDSVGPTEADLSLPRFALTSGFDLGQQLKAMGMPAAFDPNVADFSGMTGDRSLYLSNVVHKAVVEVTEEGTVAAAATGGMVFALAMARPLEIKLDRPFLFLIRAHSSGALLFLGRVADPR